MIGDSKAVGVSRWALVFRCSVAFGGAGFLRIQLRFGVGLKKSGES
jgi:hypothetical protein